MTSLHPVRKTSRPDIVLFALQQLRGLELQQGDVVLIDGNIQGVEQESVLSTTLSLAFPPSDHVTVKCKM